MCGQISYFICIYEALLVLAVCQVNIRCCRNPHIHTLGGSLFLIVSLPVYSSNQCWHTALCGTPGQLGDTYRFRRSIILTTFLLS